QPQPADAPLSLLGLFQQPRRRGDSERRHGSRARHLRDGSARDLAGRETGGLALPAGPPSRDATRRGGARHEHASRDEPPLSLEAVLFDFGGTLEADGVNWGPRF